ncbi:hypothetical protein T484DRAFT_1768795 [Baffinella frigidus]|nr:hypothetical protein T484DRAFT_1768795 [Cryptophyta sp. CCMP2293]
MAHRLPAEAAPVPDEPEADDSKDPSALVLVAGAAGTRSAKYQLANQEGEDAGGGSVPRPIKLGRWALWDAMGRPRTVCAPMVEQSELAFRLLCRTVCAPMVEQSELAFLLLCSKGRAMGRPWTVCALMVEQSELVFRLLCRKYGTDLCYTPMIHSRLWVESPSYRREIFSTCG